MSNKWRRILLASAVLAGLAGILIYWRYDRVILNVPQLMCQPVSVVETISGSPQQVERRDDGSETRRYVRPVAHSVNYNEEGKAVSIYLGPHAMYAAGLRFSGHRRWMRRFGFPRLPAPDVRHLERQWTLTDGTKIIVRFATSGDWGVDVGGDSNDVEVLFSCNQ